MAGASINGRFFHVKIRFIREDYVINDRIFRINNIISREVAILNLWGKDIARTRYVGQVYVEQLRRLKSEGNELLRISHKCENCNDNEYYSIYETSRLFRIFNLPLLQCNTVYYFSCPECNYGFKLEQKEFERLEKLANINSEYLEGKITRTEFESSIRNVGA